jgi:hypothetical protein
VLFKLQNADVDIMMIDKNIISITIGTEVFYIVLKAPHSFQKKTLLYLKQRCFSSLVFISPALDLLILRFVSLVRGKKALCCCCSRVLLLVSDNW